MQLRIRYTFDIIPFRFINIAKRKRKKKDSEISERIFFQKTQIYFLISWDSN